MKDMDSTSKNIIIQNAYDEIMNHIKLSHDTLKFTTADAVPKEKWYFLGKVLMSVCGNDFARKISCKLYETVKHLMRMNDPFFIEVFEAMLNLDVCWDDFVNPEV